MTEQQWADFLKINNECYKVIKENKLNNYDKFKELFSNKEDFLNLCKILDLKENLSYFFYLSYELVENYTEDYIESYKEGCDNIRLWADFNLNKNGYYGIEFEFACWIYNILTKSVVRLGRLEFEDFKLEFDVECLGQFFPKGTRVINTHIPATGPLNYEDCIKSYDLALDYYKLDKAIFMCESWLLAPCLDEMVSENSNINKFRKNYETFKVLWDSRLFEERIFDGNIYDDPNKYKATTSLQKKAKEKLLNGEKLPTVYGFYIYEK